MLPRCPLWLSGAIWFILIASLACFYESSISARMKSNRALFLPICKRRDIALIFLYFIMHGNFITLENFHWAGCVFTISSCVFIVQGFLEKFSVGYGMEQMLQSRCFWSKILLQKTWKTSAMRYPFLGIFLLICWKFLIFSCLNIFLT